MNNLDQSPAATTALSKQALPAGAVPEGGLVRIVNRSPHPLPDYESAAAAGMDLRAHLPDGAVHLAPLARAAVPTGLYIALPMGYEAQLRPRSGLALRSGLTLLNSPGTIDADYRGELRVLMVNLSDQPVAIADGTRIAQLVLAAHGRIRWQPVDALTALGATDRGEQGFGSTGMD